MSAERTDMHRLQGLVRLHRMGKGARTVARLLCISPNTERQYREILQRADLLSGEPDKLPELWLLKEAVRSCARKSLEKEDGLIFAFDADYICIMGSNHEYAVG